LLDQSTLSFTLKIGFEIRLDFLICKVDSLKDETFPSWAFWSVIIT